jgi:hypothetical protein
MDLYVLSGPVREFLERLESVSTSIDRNNLGIDNKRRYTLGDGENLLNQGHNVRILPRCISWREKFGIYVKPFLSCPPNAWKTD